MKTAELTGAALDWAVAKCEGYPIKTMEGYGDMLWQCGPRAWQPLCKYSTDWALAGLIIEREKIGMFANYREWFASMDNSEHMDIYETGATPLEAAMRCYCCAKLGDEIEIPKELK